MSHNTIPERNPIGDPFSGSLLYDDKAAAYAITPHIAPNAVATGDFIIRYGIRFLGKPMISIVPGILALDYGEMLTGEAAWDFIFNKSNLYPRADVVGYRHDGEDDMIPLKHLDVALTPDVLIYADSIATKPLAKVTALIATEQQAQNLPSHLLQYLPRFESISEWQSHG
ncbi:MAG: hypothetical protein Kow00117_21460 [Phototrophicales bacterium]